SSDVCSSDLGTTNGKLPVRRRTRRSPGIRPSVRIKNGCFEPPQKVGYQSSLWGARFASTSVFLPRPRGEVQIQSDVVVFFEDVSPGRPFCGLDSGVTYVVAHHHVNDTLGHVLGMVSDSFK